MLLAGPASADERRFELELAALMAQRLPPTLRVIQGDRVVFHWRGGESGELHLHGLDLRRVLRAGEPTEWGFVAQVSGRFPLTLHRDDGHHHRPLLYLEVHPR